MSLPRYVRPSVHPRTDWFMRAPGSQLILGAETEPSGGGGGGAADLSPSAGAVWGLLETPRTLADLIEAIGTEATNEVERIENALDDLLERGLILEIADGDD